MIYRVSRFASIVIISSLFYLGTSCHLVGQVDNSDPFWKTSTPGEEGLDGAEIDAIHSDILDGDYGLIDHFLLIRNGKIIAEHHYEQDYVPIMEQYDTSNHLYNYDHVDWHPYYMGTDLHTLQSVTKSVTSVLLGIALDRGLIAGVDTEAMTYFNDFVLDRTDERIYDMSISDLLTMQCGIEWDEQNYSEADNSCIIMEGEEDWIQYVLDQPMDEDPGTVFEYNSGASVLLGKIVWEATGKRIDQWAEDVLFGPLGIEEYYWKMTPRGEVDTEGGLYLSARSLAKIGFLMMNEGMWSGKRIVSKEWVDKSLTPHVRFNTSSGYGYQWWIPSVESGEMAIFAGYGYGGQFLMVSPEENLLVVFNGWNIHSNADKSSRMALEDRILPAIIK